jgi:octopine/nopaline transport system substrate-binding protein
MKTRVFVVALALGLAAASAASAKDWTKVRVATEGAYPPWNATEPSGKLIGFDIDVVNEVCSRVKLECSLEATEWKTIIPSLNAGKFDAIIAGMQITEKRLEAIDFAGPYAGTPSALAVIKGSPLAAYKGKLDRIDLNEVTPEEKAELDAFRALLKGKVVGVQTSTTHSAFLDKYVGDVVTVRKYDTQENLDMDLQSGRVDAAQASMSYWFPRMKETPDKYVIVGAQWSGEVFGKGNGIGIRKSDPELKAQLNKGIASMLQDGTMQKLAVKWFGFDNSFKK